MEVDVIVTTFGEMKWNWLGEEAADAANDQAPAHHFHAVECGSLGDARNQAVDHIDPKGWICFLDADDELEPGYIDAMAEANERFRHDEHLLVPALRLGDGPVMSLSERNMMEMNPCPIGTLIHRGTFDRAGRFWNERAWEDWSLFRRAFIQGASLAFVPKAVYHARSTASGRNSTIEDSNVLYQEILRSHRRWANAG